MVAGTPLLKEDMISNCVQFADKAYGWEFNYHNMKKREADFGVLFRHWIKANPRFSCAVELKQTQKKSIPFSCVEQHQIDYLTAINSDKGVLIRVQGVNGEPDYIYLRNAPAYVFIKFPGEFHGLSIDNFVRLKEISKRKSLTVEQARNSAVISVDLTDINI